MELYWFPSLGKYQYIVLRLGLILGTCDAEAVLVNPKGRNVYGSRVMVRNTTRHVCRMCKIVVLTQK